MNSGNTFDDEKTVFIYPQSEESEDNLLFFLENDPDNKLTLISGDAVTIGRSIESDFFIENKTVSRNHLTIKREDHQVNIEIHGRNGLYMDDQLHTGPFMTVRPPVSFTIGDVSCRLEFEIDEDKTIIVTADQRTGMKHTISADSQPAFATPPPPEPKIPPPFDPSPNDTFIPTDRPAEHKGWSQEREGEPPLSQPASAFPVQPEPPFEPLPGTGPARFDPVPRDKMDMLNEKQGMGNWLAANKSSVIIAGIIALSIIIIIFIFFTLFGGHPDKKVLQPNLSTQNSVDRLPAPPPEPAPEQSHQAFLDLANELIKSGDIVTARDVLKDIPENSPYYSRAQKILEKLPEN